MSSQNITRKLWVVCLLLVATSLAKAQTKHYIEFNANGKINGNLPQVVRSEDSYCFSISFDKGYFDKRAKEAIDLYLDALNNLMFEDPYKFIEGVDNTETENLRNGFIYQVQAATKYLNNEDKAIVTQRLTFLKPRSEAIDQRIPPLDSLIIPQFFLELSYYDSNGNFISKQTLRFETDKKDLQAKNYKLNSDELQLKPLGATLIKYELREKNGLYSMIQKQLAGTDINQQQQKLIEAMESIKKKANIAYFANYDKFQEKAKIAKQFLTDPSAKNTIDTAWINNTQKNLIHFEKETDQILLDLKNDHIKKWFFSWTWLTKGYPKVNPFEFQAKLLFPDQKGANKVSEKEKALVEMYDALVAKEAFKATEISPTLAKDLEPIAEIKARMKAEASAVSTSNNADILWNQGEFRLSPTKNEENYMVIHDAADQYRLATPVLRELTENQKVFIYTANNKPGNPIKIEVVPTAITNDQTLTSDEYSLSKFKDLVENTEELVKQTLALLEQFNNISKKVEFIKALNAAPKFPILLQKSTTPIYRMDPNIYNTVFQAPQLVEYKLFTGPADKQVEVFKGNFRVNKLYRIRFKAGLLYSGFKVASYTQQTDNSYIEKKEPAGIDGSFGLQIFLSRTDIRNISLCKVAPFFYAGLSMKNITQNFYPGFGFEIFSGFSVVYIQHIGRTQVLTSNGQLPLKVSNKWRSGPGAALLIDPNMFADLFGFGSKKSLLGF